VTDGVKDSSDVDRVACKSLSGRLEIVAVVDLEGVEWSICS